MSDFEAILVCTKFLQNICHVPRIFHVKPIAAYYVIVMTTIHVLETSLTSNKSNVKIVLLYLILLRN